MSGGVHPRACPKATVFKQGRMPVVARFSFGGGMPFMKDDPGAVREPVKLVGPLVLPAIMPHDQILYAGLRGLHTVLAYLLILTFLAHLGAALFHWLVRRDGVFESMAHGRRR